jgi:hypothetical protein
VSKINEAGGLAVVNPLGEGAMEKGVLDVQLVHWRAPRDNQSQHGADGGELHDGVESLIVVHIGALS